jgi:N-acyl homoserine lactone hydrolase
MPQTVLLELQAAPYEIFDRHADLFGDGSVVVVPLSGHTPGSVGVFVRRPDGRRIFHVGDAGNSRKELERLRGRTRGLRRTDSDRPRAERIVARLHAFAKQVDDVIFLPAHDRAAWRETFGNPALSCPTI